MVRRYELIGRKQFANSPEVADHSVFKFLCAHSSDRSHGSNFGCVHKSAEVFKEFVFAVFKQQTAPEATKCHDEVDRTERAPSISRNLAMIAIPDPRRRTGTPCREGSLLHIVPDFP